MPVMNRSCLFTDERTAQHIKIDKYRKGTIISFPVTTKQYIERYKDATYLELQNKVNGIWKRSNKTYIKLNYVKDLSLYELTGFTDTLFIKQIE